MRSTLLAILIACGAPMSAAVAHTDRPGHHSHGPINQLEAEDAARGVIGQMVRSNAVEPSWVDARIVGAERKTREKRQEWIVTLRNDQASDPAKRTLYIFLSNTGGYIAANHTGR